MVSCLDTKSYVRIRNGLIVLDRVHNWTRHWNFSELDLLNLFFQILPFYPVVSNFFVAIDKRVQALMVNEKEKRPDLYTLAFG